MNAAQPGRPSDLYAILWGQHLLFLWPCSGLERGTITCPWPFDTFSHVALCHADSLKPGSGSSLTCCQNYYPTCFLVLFLPFYYFFPP